MAVLSVAALPVQARTEGQVSRGGSAIDTALVGTWISGLGRLQFNSDGTGRYYLDEGFGVPPFSHPMTWSVSGNQLTWTVEGRTNTAAYAIDRGTLTIGEDWYLDRL
jgi:hypothetical protein